MNQPPSNPPPGTPRSQTRARGTFPALFMLCIALLAGLGLRTAAAQEFNLRQLTHYAGLHNLSVIAMVVDTAGDTWVATDGGLYRFDGSTFTLYNESRGLIRDFVGALAVSPDGKVFVRTDEGIFVGNASRFEAIQTRTGPIQSDLYSPLLALSDHQLLYRRGNQLYQLDRTGLRLWHDQAVFTEAALQAQPQLRNVYSLLQGLDGSLWFGCGDGICHRQDGRILYFGADAGVPPGEYGALLQDSQGQLWARSAGHLVLHERNAAGFTVRDPPHVAIGDGSRSIMLGFDPQRHLVTRTRQGLAVLDGEHWREYGPDNGLPGHGISQSVVDHEGNFWLGVQGTGLYRWSGYGNVESWTSRQGLALDAVWTIMRDRQHRLILGTDAGCQMLDEKVKRVVPCPWTGLPAEQTATGVMDAAGNYWLSYQTGQLWEVPAGSARARRITSVPPHSAAMTLLFDHPGEGLLPAPDTGITVLDTRTLTTTLKQIPGNPRVDEIARAADGSVLAATTGGLYILRDNRLTRVPTLLDGQNIQPDTLIGTPDGDIWASRIGSPIMHLSAAGTARQHIEWIKLEPEELTVYSLRTDYRGWIWANTGNGVSLYDGHTWRRMGTEDGLIWSDTEQGAFYADDDGSVWLGTSNGLTHLKDPERWIRDTSRPVQLQVSLAQFGKTDLLTTAAPSLPWHPDTALDVTLSARALERAPRTLLRYRLLGLSSQWATTESFALHIPALAPGHYELEAMAVDTAHDRTSPTSHLAFDITPPWWQTRWIHAAEAAAVAGSVALLWQLMIRRHRRQQAQQEQQRRDHERLLERATRDGLTGLWNRATVLELLSGEIETARRNGVPLAVALADVDHFKLINDSLGHAGGDEVLRQLTQRLRGSFRQSDIIGRYGGEELLIVMPGMPEADRGSLLDNVRSGIASEPFILGSTELHITISIGVAWLETDEAATDLIRRADHALYEAKSAGRNRVMYHQDGDSNPASLEATASRRYLQELLERMKRETPPK